MLLVLSFDVGLVGVPSEVDTSPQDISGDFSRSFSIIGMECQSLLLRSFREHKPISSITLENAGIKASQKCYNCDKFGHLARNALQESLCRRQTVQVKWKCLGTCSMLTVQPLREKHKGNVDLLVDVSTNVAGKLQMLTGALVNVAGMGSLVIDTTKGRKFIREVIRTKWSWCFLLGFSQAKCVALSTAEAEYISASEATAHAIWLRFVLEDFGELHTEATPLQCDNTSAIAITKNLVFHQKTLH
ncbi:unnamed protein product, partial [Prunus brigantina]